jgi:cardiolipin synthase
LLDVGVKIHLYRDHFLHAKHLSIDDDIALVGSSNLDIRSFALNAEIMLIFYSTDVAARLHEVERRYFAHSEVVRDDEWPNRSLASKIVQNLARMMSPLL